MGEILKTDLNVPDYPNLIVGNSTNDDCAVYDLGDGTGVLSTTDFFMPIVDDPFNFGRIAACNSLSDVYAMGGKPLMAISIFGWPANKIPAEVAAKVIDGGRSVCMEAGIPLAGGHSIDSPEPIFGLAVTGLVDIKNVKKNNSAKSGDKLFLTKPIGIGILTTAQKKKKIEDGDLEIAVEYMCTLNSIGAKISNISGVHALTDVTGFGLGGHLIEICKGSGLKAVLDFDKIPVIDKAQKYQELGCIPGGTGRNFESYKAEIGELTDSQKEIIFDPQTSGGLLVTVEESAVDEFLRVCSEEGLELESFGELTDLDETGQFISISK